ncbi:ABC transporter [Paecilomyces variotii No. 5]|uniref:ABC transporter n=1 Tax=Byssochlamys spectabilis (strain No. 5 / NBRC 109023) TaxID=1356009 RepID=V5G276_BYSSN|nr:ABC transporter [Paecilomyces variotii No. 5]
MGLGQCSAVAVRYAVSFSYTSNHNPHSGQQFEDNHALQAESSSNDLGWTISLFILSVAGFIVELIQLILPGSEISSLVILASWGIAAILVAVRRPSSCPTSLLLYYLSVLAVEISVALFIYSPSSLKHAFRYGTIGIAAAACLTILLMPLREPSLPSVKISPVGQPPSSDYRSPEDNLRLWQFLTVSWMAPLISIGRKRQLDEQDVWFLGFEFQHRRLHEKFRRLRGSVLARVLRANGLDVFIICAIAIVQMFCDFSTPVLLQQLLLVMRDPTLPNRVPLTYALLSLLLRLIAAQSQVFNLWYGRRCYERSRGEMIMMVYEKALSRKNIVGPQIEDKHEETDGEADRLIEQDVEHESQKPSTKTRRLCGIIPWKRKVHQEHVKEAASMGKIFNLLRGDVYEVAQRFWEVDSLIDKPAGLVIAVVLVWELFGPSCLLGVLAVLVAQAVNAIITRTLLQWERVRRRATDARLQITSQFVEAIRHLRWYGWQNHWLLQVMDARNHELNLRIITSLWNILIRFINTFASGVFPVVALYAYAFLAGHALRIDIIFPALQLFTMLETRLRDIPGLVTALINASVALGRIEDFMSEPDKEKASSDSNITSSVQLESCSFAWPGKRSPVLWDLTLTIADGLTVVHGKVGAGKTALLQALLGELDKLGGVSRIPDEMAGYCAQSPWLQSMSIRDNILFSSPYDEHRYKQVLDACALLPDLSSFKHGDLSFIGENGIGLSGGQKARVALARAVYSTARILLLDDPLSALDFNTAEDIVRKCFSGPLMRGRIVVLVTHRTTLVEHIADQFVEISDGRVTVNNKPRKSTYMIDQTAQPESDGIVSENQEDVDENIAAAVPDKFLEEEHRAQWGVQAKVYWNYIKAGKLKWWAALITILAIYRLASVGQSWFLKEWGEAYNLVRLVFGCFPLRRIANAEQVIQPPPPGPLSFHSSTRPVNPIDMLPPPMDDVKPWLLTFFIITTFQSVTLLVAQLLMLVIIYCAAKTLFQQVMAHVSHATFRFFDVTPVGRLMNRLTSDIGVVDGNISEQFQVIAFEAITWLSSILVIASVTPAFLVFSFILTAGFVMIFLKFLPASQSLRRLEMVSLSPLISNFGELLHGLTTVRAFRAETRFQDRVIEVVDRFQGMDHFYWSLQSWLMYRFEGLSALSTFCLTALALYMEISPGLAAFVLIAANSFVASTHALCKQYGQLQMDFVSVERIDELRHIEQEPPGTIDPPASWPTYGSAVVFENVTIRYAPHLDPSLTNVSVRIPGGSTAAILGRTGSGKSTFALSLLAAIRPEAGRILIDSIDIAKVSTQALRTRVTFVAQDPILFPGSIRLNLDPTNEYSDGECADVLRRMCRRHRWTLETHIEAGGRNLSQGQRQLIGLTRAVLRRSPIVILDEATASIDHETSLEIQQIIRDEMRQSTVITIAHRLEAIKDADYYVVLDQGTVSKEGPVNGTVTSYSD